MEILLSQLASTTTTLPSTVGDPQFVDRMFGWISENAPEIVAALVIAVLGAIVAWLRSRFDRKLEQRKSTNESHKLVPNALRVTREEVLAQYGGGQFSVFKNALADLAVAKLGPIGDETKRLQNDPVYVESVLKDGSARARAISAPIVRKAREVVGFIVS